jgi:arginase family enzyme
LPSAISIAGIPLDLGVTNRAGTREGPAAIRWMMDRKATGKVVLTV